MSGAAHVDYQSAPPILSLQELIRATTRALAQRRYSAHSGPISTPNLLSLNKLNLMGSHRALERLEQPIQVLLAIELDFDSAALPFRLELDPHFGS